MSPCVIKVENAWLRFIQVVSALNSSVEGRITLTTTSCKSTLDTVLYFGISGLSMILYL